jgi:hypothetical protein
VEAESPALATLEGVARGWGMGEAASSPLRSSRGGRANRLGAGLLRLGEHPRKKGGARTGPNPTDKGKTGSKRHLVVDRKGIPLCVMLTASNVHDSMVLEDLIDGIEPIKRPRGRPRKRPEKLHAYPKPTTTKSVREL